VASYLGYKGQRKEEEKQELRAKYLQKSTPSIISMITTSLTDYKQAPNMLDTNDDADTRQVLDCVSISTHKSRDDVQAMNIAHAEAQLRAAAGKTRLVFNLIILSVVESDFSRFLLVRLYVDKLARPDFSRLGSGGLGNIN
jgi:hypothetical protein